MRNYSIIELGKLYPITSDFYLISGQPFLYHKDSQSLILGDLHLGQESALFGIDNKQISKSCKELTKNIIKLNDVVDIQTVICNGDIKHHTKSIKIQEVEELKYFVSSLIDYGVDIIFIEGNHDPLLEFLIPHVSENKLYIKKEHFIGNTLIHHGHLMLEPNDLKTIIISHEHPSFTFYGINRARVKLPAFVVMEAQGNVVIILPAANGISSGTYFPPKSNEKFLSPYLQKYGEISSMEIFPFDEEIGIFELPPVNYWTKD